MPAKHSHGSSGLPDFSGYCTLAQSLAIQPQDQIPPGLIQPQGSPKSGAPVTRPLERGSQSSDPMRFFYVGDPNKRNPHSFGLVRATNPTAWVVHLNRVEAEQIEYQGKCLDPLECRTPEIMPMGDPQVQSGGGLKPRQD